MNKSSKSNIWNSRAEEIKKDDEELLKDEIMAGDSGEHNELIDRIQHRLGISREEAQRIIQSSDSI